MNSLRMHMSHYRAEHKTAGCRISHMIGVPMIIGSLPVLIWNWQVGLAMFVVGWAFQFAGHRYFEQNKPVLMADPKNPLTYLAALIFVTQEWFALVTGQWFALDAPQVVLRTTNSNG